MKDKSGRARPLLAEISADIVEDDDSYEFVRSPLRAIAQA